MRKLTQHECLALLARNQIGRLAFSRDGRPDIAPLHYVHVAGWIYGRTSEGAKLRALEHDGAVAFEAGEMHGPLDWASVVVRGSFHRLDESLRDAEAARAVKALEAWALGSVRTFSPDALTPGDRAPFRTVLFRVAVGEIAGCVHGPGLGYGLGSDPPFVNGLVSPSHVVPGVHMPAFRSLEQPEMEALLSRKHVGRLAFTFHDHVDIEPMHYVYADSVLYARTSPGHKLPVLERHRWVAFEVDEIEGLFEWRSVVVHGGVFAVTPGATPADRATYDRTLARLRELVPAIVDDDDPTPRRTELFRIHVDRMSGRAATAA